MPDFAGSPQSVIVSRALVLLLAIPLLGAVIEALRTAGAFGDDAARAPDNAARRGAMHRLAEIVIVATALATVAFAAELLAQSTGDKYLLQHVVSWVRAGQLDVNLDLALDPLACGALAVTLGLAGLAVRARVEGRRILPLLACLAGAVLAILSVDLVGILAGLLIVLAALVVGAPRASRAAIRRQVQLGFVGIALLGVSSALFYWGSGGDFRVDGYTSDFRPRLASVQVGRFDELHAAVNRGEGLLTIAAYPGSEVFVDDSHTPLERDGATVRTPFSRLPLHAGSHTFRVHPGMGLDDLVVTQQPMGEGRELVLLPVGSSLAPRQLADQLALEDADAARPLRDQDRARTFGGHGSVWLVASLVAIAFALVWAAGACFGVTARGPAALRTLAALLGAYVLARLEPLLALPLGGAKVAIAIGLAAAAAAVPLFRGRGRGPARTAGAKEPTRADDAVTPEVAGPLAPVVAMFRRMDAWLAPLPGPGVAEAIDVAAATRGAERSRVIDAVLAGLLAVFVLVLLVGGR